MKKTTEKPRLKGCKGGSTPLLDRNVMSFVSFALIFQPLKRAYRLSDAAICTLLVIAYFSGVGVTVWLLTSILFGGMSGAAYRSMQYRIVTLLDKGLIERFGGKYRLSAMGVEALSRVTVGGEGAKILADIDRKMKRDADRRAKKMAGGLSQ